MPSSARSAAVGVSDHAGWAVLVTVARGALLDRRRVELVEPGVPVMPYHHDAVQLPVAEGVALVARVTASAASSAAAVLAALAAEVPGIASLSLRACPKLPATVAERLASVHARNHADWVMYRQALAGAAEARGWQVRWYDAKTILADEPIAARIAATGRELGPPWTKDHKLAMAAALAANKL